MKTTIVSAAICAGARGARLDLVSSQSLQGLITVGNLQNASAELQGIADDNGGNRVFGSSGHNATVDWLIDRLTALDYYDVVKQPFQALYSNGNSTVSVAGRDNALPSQFMTYSPSGSASARLVYVGLGCAIRDFADVADRIALIGRGTCSFANKTANARAAGALAAVVYDNVPGTDQPFGGTLGGTGDYVPTVGISNRNGTDLLAALQDGDVTIDLRVDTVNENRTTYNVIATSRGGDQSNLVLTGAHSDSVPAGPGINDNGSGSVGILQVAVALAEFEVTNAVRFAWWSAEEFGLLGSEAYVASLNGSDLAKIRAVINVDMIASQNYILAIYDGDGSAYNLTGPAGSDLIEADFEDFFVGRGLPSVPTEFNGRSDYAAFIAAGIPAGGLFTGAEGVKTAEEAFLFGGTAGEPYDAYYHTAEDDYTKLNFDAFLVNTHAIANSVAKYAVSFAGFPASNATAKTARMRRAVGKPRVGRAGLARRGMPGRRHQPALRRIVAV